jgi:hypothetical protein
MLCTFCGTNHPDDATFCLFCGQPLRSVQPQREAVGAAKDDGEPRAVPATIAVASQAPTAAGATIVVEKHSAESLAKSQVAPPLPVKPNKRPFVIFGAAAAIVLLAAFWPWYAERVSRERRIEELIRQAGAFHSKSAQFTRRIQELRSHPTTTMKEYHDQCAGLESPLADARSAARSTDLLVEQIKPEFQKTPEVLAVLDGMKKAADLDQRLQGDVRQEILLSKTLMHLEPYEQIEFFSMSIHPVHEEEKQLAAEEQQIISQIQDDGRKLPPDLSRALLSQY